MVAAQNVRIDFRVYDPVLHIFRHQKIIDTPSRIVCACVKPVRPPGIPPCFPGCKYRKESIKPASSSSVIFSRSCGVNPAFFAFDFGFLRSISYVQHSNRHRRSHPSFVQGEKVRTKIILPFHTVIESLKALL